MSNKITFDDYRDELVQTIKLMGQELIDRAESMVHEDCDMITNFNINIDIPQPMDGHPELTWSTSALSKNFYNKELGHSAGDAKMETHVESVTVEKKEDDPMEKHEVFIEEDRFAGIVRVAFVTRKEAEDCLEQLKRICETYSAVTMADLYDLCAMRNPYHGNQYRGWANLEHALIESHKHGHVLILDMPIPFR